MRKGESKEVCSNVAWKIGSSRRVSSALVSLEAPFQLSSSHRNRLPKAYQTFLELPGHYGPGGWSSLQSFMRYQAIRVHAQSKRVRDQEWVMLVTEFLRMYTHDLSRELLAQAADMKAYLSVLTEQLKAAASKLESGSFQEYHRRCGLTSSPRCVDRGSPHTHIRDT